MIIVLPNDRNGLPGLLQKLAANATEFARVLERDSYMLTRVSLGLPKFSIHGDTIPLSGVLASMGLSSLFGGDDDLSGITGSRDLYVSPVQHKALIDVSGELNYSRVLNSHTFCGWYLSWRDDILLANILAEFTQLLAPMALFSFSRLTRRVPKRPLQP